MDSNVGYSRERAGDSASAWRTVPWKCSFWRPAADFLELEDSHLAVPVLTHALTSRGVAPYSYLLLVGASSPAVTVSDQRGKNVLVSSRGGSNTASLWLEVFLSKENFLGRTATFFASFRKARKGAEIAF